MVVVKILWSVTIIMIIVTIVVLRTVIIVRKKMQTQAPKPAKVDQAPEKSTVRRSGGGGSRA